MSAAAKRWISGVLVAILVLAGLYGVGDAVAVWITVGVGTLVLLAVWRRSWSGVAVVGGHLLGAILVGFLALAGFDVLVNLLHHLPPLEHVQLPIPVGLVFALAVFGLVVYWYLNRAGWHVYWSTVAACELAALIILAAPYVFGKLTANTDPVSTASAPVASKLDVLMVGDGRQHSPPPELPPTPALGEFDVTYSVGYAAGDTVRWTLADGDSAGEALRALAEGSGRPAVATAPAPREGADPVLLLLVDGTAPFSEDPAHLPEVPYRAGEVERWKQVAASAGAAEIPAYALLQTTNAGRLAHWKRFQKAGAAVSVQALESQTATDAAVRLAVAAPTAKADFALAMKYRPILLFDHSEPVPWPLSVGALFGEERVRLCHDEGVAKTECGSGPVLHPAELENGGTHLRLTLRDSDELRHLAKRELAADEAFSGAGVEAEAAAEPGAPPEGTPPPGAAEVPAAAAEPAAPPGAGSAIYVHPMPIELHGRELLYLDYWWYLPDNPVSLGGGALCGAGLVIAGVTCQNHQSDWEGMTVVVDRSGAEPRVTAVQYAEHENVVRYRWGMLRRRWDRDPKVKKLVAGVSDASLRPLAFIASGTHATYAVECGDCSQVTRTEVGEESHLGDFPWVGDDSGACGRSSCLQLLPTRLAGAEPALWNAFEGTWGEHDCFLTYYCDSGTPPAAPGQQGRYQHPAHYSGEVDERWRYQPLVEG